MSIEVSSGYFKDHRRTVECRIQFIKLGEIYVIQEMFRATVVIKSKWTEHGMLIDKYDPEVHWNPELFVENWKRIPASTNVVNISYTVQHKNDSTVVIETREIQGDFWERLELYEFPLDIQELSITICSKLDSSELEIIPDQEKLSTIHPRAFKTFESQQVYRLHSVVKTQSFASYEQSVHYKSRKFEKKEGKGFSAVIKIARKSNMYVITIFSLVFIVLSLTMTTFVDPGSKANARNKSLFSLLLTLFAYKITISNQLPFVSYLTLIDKYMISSIVFTASIAAWNAILDALEYSDSKSIEIDRVALYVFIVIFVCIHVAILIMVAIALRRMRQLSLEDKENLLTLIHLPYDINTYNY